MLVVTTAAVAVGGCGGSGAGRLTAMQLAAQGDAICSHAAAAERAIQTTNMASALPSIAAISDRELAELDKLLPPASEQSSYAALLDDFSQLNRQLQRLSSALARSGSAPPDLLSHGRELAAKAAALAGPLGLAACSTPAPAS